MTLSVTPWMSTQGGSLHTHENMLVGGSSSSSLSELASVSTQHRSSRHTRPPTRTSTVARSSSGPECSGREQVALGHASALDAVPGATWADDFKRKEIAKKEKEKQELQRSISKGAKQKQARANRKKNAHTCHAW